MAMLAERLAPVRIETVDAVGWSADALEAQAFAYLAVRSLCAPCRSPFRPPPARRGR